MPAHTVSLGARSFTLDPHADLDAFRAELEGAVQRGGGIIDVPVVGAESVSVLVSPGFPIVFTTHPDSDDAESVEPPATSYGTWNPDDMNVDFW